MASIKHLSRKTKTEIQLDPEWEPETEASARMLRAYGSMSVSRSGRFKSKTRQRKSLMNSALDTENKGHGGHVGHQGSHQESSSSSAFHSTKNSAALNDVTTTSPRTGKQTTDGVTVTSSNRPSTTDYGRVRTMTSPEVERNAVVPNMAKGTAFTAKTKASGYSTAL